MPHHPCSAPAERPFKVYCFTPATRTPEGWVCPAFWYEDCACQDEYNARTIRNMLALALPGMHFVVAQEPPTDIPDPNVYDSPRRSEGQRA